MKQFVFVLMLGLSMFLAGPLSAQEPASPRDSEEEQLRDLERQAAEVEAAIRRLQDALGMANPPQRAEPAPEPTPAAPEPPSSAPNPPPPVDPAHATSAPAQPDDPPTPPAVRVPSEVEEPFREVEPFGVHLRVMTDRQMALCSPSEIEVELQSMVSQRPPFAVGIDELERAKLQIEHDLPTHRSLRDLAEGVDRVRYDAIVAGLERKLAELETGLPIIRGLLQLMDEGIAQRQRFLAQWERPAPPAEPPPATPEPPPAPAPEPPPALEPTPPRAQPEAPPAPQPQPPSAPVEPAPAQSVPAPEAARADTAPVTTQVYVSRTGVYRLELDVVQFRLMDRDGNVYPALDTPPLTARVANAINDSDRGVRADGLVWVNEDVIDTLIPDATRRQGLQVIWGPFWDRCPARLEGPVERSSLASP